MIRVLLLLSLLLYQGSSAANIIDKKALVIGNSSYGNAPLANPVNDAEDVAAVLRKLGFDVTLKTNITHKQMEQSVDKLTRSLKKDAVGLFYYAGHGVQVNGQNYLIPISHGIDSKDQIKYRSMSASHVLRSMEKAGNKLNIIILDACRNNPFKGRARSLQMGLARLEGPIGSIIAYATAPGQVAADGEGRNGTYTKHLVSAMQNPGLSLEGVFKKVRIGVMNETDGKQIPWEESSLREDFFFIDDNRKTATSPEFIEWQGIQFSKVADDFSSFLAKYPQGMFAEYAKNRLEHLQQQQAQSASTQASSSPVTADQQAWSRVANSHKVASLKKFVAKHPDSPHIKKARLRIKNLQSGQVSQGLQLANDTVAIKAQCISTGCVDGFHIAKFEVTVGQFVAFTTATGYVTDAEKATGGKSGCIGHYKGKMNWQRQLNWKFPGFPQEDRDPVVCVSHQDAQAYIKWLNRSGRHKYRLPRDLEWQVAARDANAIGNYWNSQADTACQFANVADSGAVVKEYFSCSDNHPYTAPVGSFLSNSAGLYDMLGNVWEWTDTFVADNRSIDKVKYISRGGSWINGPAKVNLNKRAHLHGYTRTNFLGFRLVRK